LSSAKTFLKSAIKMGFAAALIASLSACARTGFIGSYSDLRCQAVSELTDGSWRVDRPIQFGRTIRVERGATLLTGEVIDGVDLGAVLERACRDPSLYVPKTAVRF
jgi:hypothetical protein